MSDDVPDDVKARCAELTLGIHRQADAFETERERRKYHHDVLCLVLKELVRAEYVNQVKVGIEGSVDQARLAADLAYPPPKAAEIRPGETCAVCGTKMPACCADMVMGKPCPHFPPPKDEPDDDSYSPVPPKVVATYRGKLTKDEP
jgi:hypothetical protein